MKFQTPYGILSALPQRILFPADISASTRSRPCKDLEDAYLNLWSRGTARPSPFVSVAAGFTGSDFGVPLRYEHTHKGIKYVMWLHPDRTALLGRYVGNYQAIELLPCTMRLADQAIDHDGPSMTESNTTREPCIHYTEDRPFTGFGIMPVLRMGKQSDYPAAARKEAKELRGIINKDIRHAFAAMDEAQPLAMSESQIDSCVTREYTFPQFLSKFDLGRIDAMNEIANAICVTILGQFKQYDEEGVAIMGRSVSTDGRLGLPAIRASYDDNPGVMALMRKYTAQLAVLLESESSPIRPYAQIRNLSNGSPIMGDSQRDTVDITAHEKIEAAIFLQSILPDPMLPEVQDLMARMPDLSGARCDTYPLAA